MVLKMPTTGQGRIQRGEAGGHAPQSSIELIFLQKNRLCWDCSLYQKCPVDLKYDKNALANTPSPIPTSLAALGASILAPSALSFCAPHFKIMATPLPCTGLDAR